MAIERIPPDSIVPPLDGRVGWMLIGMADHIWTTQDQQAMRPRYHFTAKSGWLNDPNGLVYYKGEYHMFFQHNPSGTQWGNMTWGHAVSKDLVHWRQVENAIMPDQMGTMFSGSAVVDHEGVGGFGKGAMVLFYTAAGGTNEASKGKPFTQGLAWSMDGAKFEKLASNPIIGHMEGENRDPKVMWDEASGKWVMALYLADARYALFTSANLKEWKKTSEIRVPGTDECPDLLQLNHKGKTYWVLTGANGNYQLGELKDGVFAPTSGIHASNHGPNSYAAQAFFGDPIERVVQIAWMRGTEFPGCSWNQQMSVPRVLSLAETDEGLRLKTDPAPELEVLRGRKLRAKLGVYNPSDCALEVRLEAKLGGNGRVVLSSFGRTVEFDQAMGILTVTGHNIPVEAKDGSLRLTVFFDTASVEVFAQDGSYSVPAYALADRRDKTVRVSSTGEVKITRAEVYELESAWPDLTGE